MYEHLDKLLEAEKKKIRTAFNRLSVTGFDELNVVNTRKTTQALFEKLLADNERLFLLAAKNAYKKAIKTARAKDFDGEESDASGELVAAVLGGYNFITGYLYNKETERKRLRLNEQILTAREYNSRAMLQTSLRRTANLWWTQTVQYGVSMVDESTIKGFKDMGVEWVQWVTAADEKTCPTCRMRDNRVYRLNKVPPKPHYGCRCYIVPIKAEEVET